VQRFLIFLASCAAISLCLFTSTGLAQRAAGAPAALAQLSTNGSAENSLGFEQAEVLGQGRGGFGVVYTFNGKGGADPTGTLIEDAAGNLYGTTSAGGDGFGVVFKINSIGREMVLHAFTGKNGDGVDPHGALVLDSFGNLYGTTSSGGAAGFGTVFKIDASGVETVLHSFTGADGANPYAGLVMDSSGNLYGTTENGGTSGFGTVFEINTGGTESVLHSFAGGATDGADPRASLILDPDGNLYGTTFAGGSANYGTVFEVDTANTETILHSFLGSDGANPFGGLTRDQNGTLYGTAEAGGSLGDGPYRCCQGIVGVPRSLPDGPHGCCRGVVFSLDGSGETVLYAFTGGNDGGTPVGNLALSNGVLYGSTLTDGPGHNGTAFSVTIATGVEKVLHGFGGKADGANPYGGLLLSSSGVLYGTAETGGRFKQGTVFQYKIK
jgi:uncharacterized repeat protein (TIGR03803 family)